MTFQHPNFIQSYFHGTKVNLSIGDLVVPGNNANYGERKAKFVYASSNLNVAIWGAELAVGDGPGRIYVVEPLGPIENDPNLTDKKFPGNPTNSFRAREGFKVVAEVKSSLLLSFFSFASFPAIAASPVRANLKNGYWL